MITEVSRSRAKRDVAQSVFILTAHTGSRRLVRSRCCGRGSTHPARPEPAASPPLPCRWVRGKQAGFPSRLLSRSAFCSAPKCQLPSPRSPSLPLSHLQLFFFFTPGNPFGLLCICSRLGAQVRQLSGLSFEIRFSLFQMFAREPELWQGSLLIFHFLTQTDSSSL